MWNGSGVSTSPDSYVLSASKNTCSMRSVAFSQLCCSAVDLATLDMVDHSSGGILAIRTMAAAIESGVASTSTPFSGVMRSGAAPARVAMTGVPQASDSSMGKPNPSELLENSQASQREYRSGIVLRGGLELNSIHSGKSYWRAPNAMARRLGNDLRTFSSELTANPTFFRGTEE